MGLNTAEAVDNVISVYMQSRKRLYRCLNTAEAVDNVIRLVMHGTAQSLSQYRRSSRQCNL